jgi:dienelactone hydrolase
MKTNSSLISRRSLLRSAAASLIIATTGAVLGAEVPNFTGTMTSHDGKALNIRVFRPTTGGPYPAVIVMHGSTGMWSNQVPNSTILSNLDTWAKWFKDNGFVAMFVDSYTNRLPGTAPANQNFQNRRPAVDSATDDAACSPTTLRPNDAYKARSWLVTNAVAQKVNINRIGLMGFSQGAETVLSAVVDESVITNKANVALTAGGTAKWAQERLELNGTKTMVAKSAPNFHPAGQQHFNVVVAYYPGCGFYSYWGKLSAATINEYMPHCPTLVMHGSADNLWGTGATPKNFVEKSRLQAINQGLATDPINAQLQSWVNTTYSGKGITTVANAVNPMTHVLFPNAHHSFDLYPSSPATAAEDGTAKTYARNIAQSWLMTYLKQ